MNISIPAFVYKAIFSIKKNSPTILTVAGVIGFVGTTILASNETIKAKDILSETKEDLSAIKTLASDENRDLEVYSEKDYKKDLVIAYSNAAKSLVKTYAPAILLGVGSAVCIFSANGLSKKRIGAIASAYACLDGAFKKYRESVVERYGEEVDQQLRLGLKAKKISTVEVSEDGSEKKVKKTVNVVERYGASEYAKFFDEASPYFDKSPEYNLMFLRTQQNYVNDLLKTRGYVFLNDVYDALGIPRTRAGQVVGWVFGGSGDDYIDFGIYDIYRGVGDVNAEARRDFVNGHERAILLDFNVDGVILDSFGGVKNEQ